MVNCCAGQDRAGVAAAMILTALGIDRDTTIRDYHLSTPSRRPRYEIPEFDPSHFPGNLIVQIYTAQRAKNGELAAEAIYTVEGRSQIAMFLDYVDETYVSMEA